MTFTVGEAAKLLGVSASTLRYYESEGLLPTLGRSQGGQRLFGEQELEACRVIGCLKQSGLSIKDIKRFMATGLIMLAAVLFQTEHRSS